MTTDQHNTIANALTFEEFLERYKAKFTRAQLTWLLRNRYLNGLQAAGAILLISRRFYIVEYRFTAWMFNQHAAK